MRHLLVREVVGAFWSVCLLCMLSGASVGADAPKPNFVIIFTDDHGYRDLGCFGSPDIKTPRIDQMAAEGMRFTDFYAQTVCGPSRAALMTGCYPLRVATRHNKVWLHPTLHSDEVTIAEVLKEVGYSSIAIGKWGLAGHTQSNSPKVKIWPDLFPVHQGFDEFFGTPGSNDSSVNLYRGEKLVERKADMSQLSRRYTDEAIDFIKRKKDQPFFVYLAHTMPHVRLAASDDFKGKSSQGLYGDVIEEIDHHVGRILDTLKAEGLDGNTYVIFTSDNGPWEFSRSAGHKRKFPNYQEHSGSALPLRGAKTSSWEGGLRVPCVIRAPGRILAGQECHELASTLDMLPTLAALAGGSLPDDRVIDGRDIRSLLHSDDGAISPTEAFYYYVRTRLHAVRAGKWKLHLPRPADATWGKYSKKEDDIAIEQPMLFDLSADAGETNNLAAKHPEVVAELMKLADFTRRDIGDFDRIGQNARFFDPEPRRADIAAEKKPKNRKAKAGS